MSPRSTTPTLHQTGTGMAALSYPPLHAQILSFPGPTVGLRYLQASGELSLAAGRRAGSPCSGGTSSMTSLKPCTAGCAAHPLL